MACSSSQNAPGLVTHSQHKFVTQKVTMHSEAALFALGWAAMIWIATAHDGHGSSQKVVSGPHKSLWYNNRLPGDGGKQVCSSLKALKFAPVALHLHDI